MLRNHLVSVNSACRAMTCVGILVGAMLPVYTAIFFGSGSFRLLYVAGCLAAGFLLAQACGYILKEFLHCQLSRQEKMLARIAGGDGKPGAHDNSELETFLEGNAALVRRVESLSQACSSLLAEISSRHHELDVTARALVQGNENELAKEREVQVAGEEMQLFFQSLLSDIEELLARAEERNDISRRMSAANDTIAENIRAYSSSVLGTSSSIEEIAFSIKESAANVQALSKSTEQTTGSISQISTAIAEVRDNIQKAAESSVNVRLQAQEGMRAMTATLQAMREIEASSEESFNAINRLAVHSARVGEFLNIIKEVVEQTNLLSLNASIIAAQAGERGKAFSVVAEEVRSLAHRTALSATEIDELVKNIQKETAAVQRAIAKGKDRGKSGVKISSLTGDSLQKIEESATEVSQMVQRIAASTVKQAAGSRLISDEAEKNLERGRQVTRAIQEQEKGIVMIVQELESMRLLAQNIANATAEQSDSNRQFLENVLTDVDQVVRLRDKGLQQSGLEDTLQGYVGEVGSLMEANAEKAGRITRDIDQIALLVAQLTRQVETFSLPAPGP